MGKMIVERWEMAHSIRLEKLYHIRQKIFSIFFLTTLRSFPFSQFAVFCIKIMAEDWVRLELGVLRYLIYNRPYLWEHRGVGHTKTG